MHSLLTSKQLIYRTDFEFDSGRLRHEVMSIIEPMNYLEDRKVKQLMLSCRKNSTDPNFEGAGKLKESEISQKEFSEFNPNFRGTYLEEVWKYFPFKIGRMRIMLLKSHSCYSLHTDREPRIHLPLKTNPGCYSLFHGRAEWYHMPIDNHLYVFHTHLPHLSMNSGDKNRLHLVFDLLEEYQNP